MKIIIALDCSEIQVSDCDHLFLSGYNWTKHNEYYNCSNKEIWNGKQVHNKPIQWFVAQLMGLKIPEGFEIDHIDRNPSNNQRFNLRVASRRLQQHNRGMQKNNTSGFIGVYFGKRNTNNLWVAQMWIDGKNKNLGCFKTPEEASEIYQAAKKIRDQEEEQRVKDKQCS